MENLWPDDLLPPSVPSDALAIDALLSSQAQNLAVCTNNVVHAEIQHRVALPGDWRALYLWPQGQKQMRYELMRVRSADQSFPVVVESYHLGKRQRYSKASSVRQLRDILKDIFADEATKTIVRSLAAESLTIDAIEEDDAGPQESPIGNQETRSISIGALIEEGGVEFAMINIFGVSGFISADSLQALSRQQNSKKSSIEQLNDRYIVTLSFLDSIKMTLTATEKNTLQAMAKKTLEDASNRER